MDPEVMVTKCICFDTTFLEIKMKAKEKNCVTIQDVQQHLLFGQKCKLCHPYIARMLETGETKFDVING